jgi:hypothetical protein
MSEGLRSGVLFAMDHWKPLAAIAAAAAFWISREQGADLARKPQLIDQIVANSLARCTQQTRFAEKGSYEERLREVFNNGVRSGAFDAYMNKKITICLDQRLPDFKGHFLENTFYATYYYNGGEPVIAVRDNGMLAKDTSIFDTNNKERSYDTLNKFASYYLQSEQGPQSTMLAYRENCGKSCTRVSWIEASTKQLGIMKSHSDMDQPPLRSHAPPVKYSPANW